MSDYEMMCFQIITSVGSAKSYYLEAINEAKKGNFEKSEILIEDGEKDFLEGHKVHTELVQRDARGEDVKLTLILMHAEDQLMTADSFKILAKEFIEIYKRIGK